MGIAVDLESDATVRMRGDEWEISPETAAFLLGKGVIWRDFDCEQNTIDNGHIGWGPCYGVTGESEGDEEAANAALVEALSKLEHGR